MKNVQHDWWWDQRPGSKCSWRDNKSTDAPHQARPCMITSKEYRVALTGFSNNKLQLSMHPLLNNAVLRLLTEIYEITNLLSLLYNHDV